MKNETRGRRRTVFKEDIFAAVFDLVKNKPYHTLQRSEIAARAGIATGSVTKIFGTMVKLQRAIVGEAIKQNNLVVIAQALAIDCPRVRKISPELKQKALDSLLNK